MPFKHFVEIGRSVYVNYGKDQGKLAVILDILNENRVLIEGPESNVERQVIPIRRLTLTRFRVPVLKNQRSGFVRKAIQKFKLQEKWGQTGAAKKLVAKAKRASLGDFDRFKVMLLKKRLNKTVVAKANKLRNEGGKPAAPKKEAPKEAKKAGKK